MNQHLWKKKSEKIPDSWRNWKYDEEYFREDNSTCFLRPESRPIILTFESYPNLFHNYNYYFEKLDFEYQITTSHNDNSCIFQIMPINLKIYFEPLDTINLITLKFCFFTQKQYLSYLTHVSTSKPRCTPDLCILFLYIWLTDLIRKTECAFGLYIIVKLSVFFFVVCWKSKYRDGVP